MPYVYSTEERWHSMKSVDILNFDESLQGKLARNLRAYRFSEISLEHIKTNLDSESATRIELEIAVGCNLRPLMQGHSALKGRIQGSVKRDHTLAYTIQQGTFTLFAQPSKASDPDCISEMTYHLHMIDEHQNKYTLYGFKSLKQGDLARIWQQTTELRLGIFEGELTLAEVFDAIPLEVGTCAMTMKNVMQSLISFRSNHDQAHSHILGSIRYLKQMTLGLQRIYLQRPAKSKPTPKWAVGDDSVLNSADISYHKFSTADGLSLMLTRFNRRSSKDVILLLHGLTTSTDMFIMPEHTSLVQYLLDHGYSDIWSLDWRGSQRYPYNLEPHAYTLDDVIRYDIPQALACLRRKVGDDVNIHVIAHCIGSLSFSCALASKQITGITSFVGNSVSLNPMVSNWSKVKICLGPEILENFLGSPYLSPRSASWPGLSLPKLLGQLVSKAHPESRSHASNMVSFLWGDGNPAAYELHNLSHDTYNRLHQLFGGVSFHYYRHIRKMVLAQAAVSFDKKVNYFENAILNGLPPTLLISGANNNIFPGSNRQSFELLRNSNQMLPLEYIEIPSYGHQDIFMGKSCRVDTFPKILHFIRQHSHARGLKNVVGE